MNEKKSKEDLKNNAAFSKKVAEKIFITIRDTTFRNMFAPFSEKVSEKDVSRKISIAHFASAPFFRKGARKRGFGLLRKLRKMFLHLFFEKVQPKRQRERNFRLFLSLLNPSSLNDLRLCLKNPF